MASVKGVSSRWRSYEMEKADRCLRLQSEQEINVCCADPLRFHNYFVTAAELTLFWLNLYLCLSHNSSSPPQVQDMNFFCISCSTKDNVKLSATYPIKPSASDVVYESDENSRLKKKEMESLLAVVTAPREPPK